MRWKSSAGILAALVFLIPAAPAMAQAAPPGLDAACQTAERNVYKDIRQFVTIDLEAATDTQVRILADQIMAEADAESLTVLPGAVQERLDGTPDDLRSFLKATLQKVWSTDLRISVDRTMSGGDAQVKAAAQKVLDDESIDAYLAYLNDGLYVARALDCAARPTPKPSVTPSAGATKPSVTPSTSATAPASAIPTSSASSGTSGGEGGLPVTGANTVTVAGIGGALLLIGGAGYLIARRRRSRFVA